MISQAEQHVSRFLRMMLANPPIGDYIRRSAAMTPLHIA
jgi:hypothetical protein